MATFPEPETAMTLPAISMPVSYTHLDVYKRQEYHGIKKIGLFGIAFSGKRVAAKYEEIQLHS